ncbi:hypothetical protein EYF80_004536 [Liparis tanakae]|uniref:Uncharacterized protein n=1 Tax=Liparis tanakae TaxID=230148 RepID=A0A4Z2J4T4_9TELE|nr:hypothetical protein EYF80_004536 [Liparis tanakae]
MDFAGPFQSREQHTHICIVGKRFLMALNTGAPRFVLRLFLMLIAEDLVNVSTVSPYSSGEEDAIILSNRFSEATQKRAELGKLMSSGPHGLWARADRVDLSLATPIAFEVAIVKRLTYGDNALSFVLPLLNRRSRGEVFPVVYVGFYMLQERQSPGLERRGGRSYAERLSRGSTLAVSCAARRRPVTHRRLKIYSSNH